MGGTVHESLLFPPADCGKFARLRWRLKDAEWRKYFATIALGRMLGLTILLTFIVGMMAYMNSGKSYA